jgi:hypothetical protein
MRNLGLRIYEVKKNIKKYLEVINICSYFVTILI